MTKTFTTQYTVTIGDINFAGHMGNDRPLVIFQEARSQFFHDIGYSEGNIGDNIGIIVVESGVRYTREVLHRDTLNIEIEAGEIAEKKFTLRYKAVRESDSELVFSGFTDFLAYNYTNRKVVKIPEKFSKILDNFRQVIS